ncbi:hypothetical protein QQX09_05960 [Demequina sp. SYSU T00192]|uniref:DUF218 domain-containing protein n=1 Tax=Demequina litoralis TaxID=3051660 RepID=A0ABT8G8D5_9MICO|nr:hypothetical protein [Demequina sp. SYSU T00192]MDN4475400.1 hypothetical protein [Demequina sp. SYSU T00192]
MKIVIVMLVVGAVAFVAGLPLYVFPAHDEPRAVDAVYVIGPPTEARMELAEEMVADGLTDTIIVSLDDDPDIRRRWDEATAVCEEPQDFTVYCSMPDPFTTRGEARWMRDLIEENGWDAVGVVTMAPHLTRTRVIMERCWDGDLAYLDSHETMSPFVWAYQYLYQTAALIKVGLEDGC